MNYLASMIGIVNEMDHNLANIVPRCRFCGGTGLITLYRSDWEGFDNIKCENCDTSTK